MAEPHQQIADLEAEIDALADSVERCRKLGIVARLTILLGGVVLASILTGLLRSDASRFLFSIAAFVGGLVLLGSNRSTKHQLLDKIAAHEARRAEMIDAALRSANHPQGV